MPIGNISVSRGGGEYESPWSDRVEAGNYVATIASVEEGFKDVYKQPGKKEPCIVITYVFTYNDDGAWFKEKHKCSAHPKSNLYKRLAAICPGELSKEVLADDDKYIALVNSLEGRKVALIVGEKPSTTDPTKVYPYLVAAMATKESGPENSTKPVPSHVSEKVSFDDDDIPF